MRRVLFPFVIAFALLSAQHAGFLHAVGHDAGRLSSPAGALAVAHAPPGGDSQDEGAYCNKCIQFAHVAGAATAAPVLWHLGQVATEHPYAPAELIRAAETPVFHSRGPPLDL
jgi:hypothetical protein